MSRSVVTIDRRLFVSAATVFGAFVRDTDPLSWAGFTHALAKASSNFQLVSAPTHGRKLRQRST